MGNYCEVCDTKLSGGIIVENKTIVPMGTRYFCSTLCLFNWVYQQIGLGITIEIKGELPKKETGPKTHRWAGAKYDKDTNMYLCLNCHAIRTQGEDLTGECIQGERKL